MRERYVGRGREGRSKLIQEVCELCGYDRKHAIKLLNGKLPIAGGCQRRGGPRRCYGEGKRLGLGTRLLDIKGASLPGDVAHRGDFIFHQRRMAIGFHQQNRLRMQREPDMGEILHGPDGSPVEKLQSARDHRMGNDVGPSPSLSWPRGCGSPRPSEGLPPLPRRRLGKPPPADATRGQPCRRTNTE